MNNNLKAILLSTSLFPIIMSCNSETKVSTVKTDSINTTAANNSQEHRYACPMHPEVIGKEGEKCPKCGMNLQRNSVAPTAAGTYFMQFVATPQVIEPNKEVLLSFTPKKRDAAGEPVDLDTQHEKKVHLILVNDDLSWFDHIHPEYTNGGAYMVKAKFPAGGKYKVFADYKPVGGRPVVDKVDIEVVGTAPATTSYTGNKLSGISGNYSFELNPTGGKLTTGTPLHIEGVLKKNGKQIDASTLENYLGAKAHFVMIGLNDKEFLHVHPEVANGKFELHTTINKPGIYRGWIQFNGDGNINTIDFTLLVMQGDANEAKHAPQDHKTTDPHAGHAH